MLRHDATKPGLLSELLLLSSGMIMFLPLLLILIVALTGMTVFR
jgi:hypothetical protein